MEISESFFSAFWASPQAIRERRSLDNYRITNAFTDVEAVAVHVNVAPVKFDKVNVAYPAVVEARAATIATPFDAVEIEVVAKAVTKSPATKPVTAQSTSFVVDAAIVFALAMIVQFAGAINFDTVVPADPTLSVLAVTRSVVVTGNSL